jgi:probable addiction module antidote protein
MHYCIWFARKELLMNTSKPLLLPFHIIPRLTTYQNAAYPTKEYKKVTLNSSIYRVLASLCVGISCIQGSRENMRNYRTIDDVTEEYLRNHPEEVDDYINELFEEYAQDGDTAALFSSLRVISRVKGVSSIAESSGMSRKGVQKALSEEGHPKFESVNAILHAMGYRLAPQRL